jgi:hypothetical protein
MAEITIGGTAYSVALPNFKKLKAAWRFIRSVSEDDAMDGVSAILGVVCVGADKPVTVEELEEQLLPAQLPTLRPFLNALLIECGLASQPGEGEPAKDRASPSTANSSGSSIF